MEEDPDLELAIFLISQASCNFTPLCEAVGARLFASSRIMAKETLSVLLEIAGRCDQGD